MNHVKTVVTVLKSIVSALKRDFSVVVFSFLLSIVTPCHIKNKLYIERNIA